MRRKEQIISLLQAGKTYGEIAQELGCSKSTISFHAKRIGHVSQSQLETSVRYDWKMVQAYYDEGNGVRACIRHFGFSSKSWNSAVHRGDIHLRPPGSYIIPLEDLLVAERKQTNRVYLKDRLVRIGLLKNECTHCGLVDWHGKPIALELDHINGKRNDNRIENLRLLCPNCHSQTDTHAGKNNRSKDSAPKTL